MPPLLKECIEKFQINVDDVCFAYGDKIYTTRPLPPDVQVHEQVHQQQQISLGVEAWWRNYIDDGKFRLSQEIEAYRAQYAFIAGTVKDRNQSFRYLHKYASDLSSAMYGNIISYQNAIKLIKKI